jgi:hypothetical protein
MTPGPPATEDVVGRLAAMCVIPIVVLDDSAAAAQLAGTLADAEAEYGAAHGALVMTIPVTPPRPKKKKSTASSPAPAPVLTAGRRGTSKRATAPARN